MFLSSAKCFSSATSLNSIPLDADIYLFCRLMIVGLIAKNASTKVSNKYVDFVDVFSLSLAFELLEYTRISNHAIKLVDGQ